MPIITVEGIKSVADRTVFTNKGPIAKAPKALLSGSDLTILSEGRVRIPSGSFTDVAEGRLLSVSGSPSGRNDGTFVIKRVLSSTTLDLDKASFDVSDVGEMTARLVKLANDLKVKFNLHRLEAGVHVGNDSTNVVSFPNAFSLSSSISLLNQIRSSYLGHISNSGGSFHVHQDQANVVFLPAATNIAGAILLANDLKRKFEPHRGSRLVHLTSDTRNHVAEPTIDALVGGPLTGPFAWTYLDPRLGMAADEPEDVTVVVGGVPSAPEAVFGHLGAVILDQRPSHGTTVLVDYHWLENPPSRMTRLNSPEFTLNQAGNGAIGGFPEHRYRSKSYLIDPHHSPDFMAPEKPKSVGWKYKGLERSQTAGLNDPGSLLLNMPAGSFQQKVLFKTYPEVTIRYDPASLPQNASDPWVKEGDGSLTLKPGGGLLTVSDLDGSYGPSSNPPFFSHSVDMSTSLVSNLAFRASADVSLLDGAFTGVACGLSDGLKVAMVGFVLTDATSLSSASVMAGALKAAFNAHLSATGVHMPNDPASIVPVVDASSLSSLIVLVNALKAAFNAHRIKTGASGIHQMADSTNQVIVDDADDLPSAIVLVNALKAAFNAHRTQTGVHFNSDFVNVVSQVRQVGILTNSGPLEDASSWVSYASDWGSLKTYRLFRDETGDVSLFLSGNPSPVISLTAANLPSLSQMDGKFDPAQQIFFGSVSREAKSVSRWALVAANLSPLDSNLIEDNKSVQYEASTTPERDSSPWIGVGGGGHERVSSGVLILDSTCSSVASDLGADTGAYRGFVRLEPVLSPETSCTLELAASGDWYTSGLDDRAACVVVDDGELIVQMSFLQFTPSPASVTGTAVEPLTIVQDDSIRMTVGSGPVFTVLFLAGDDTASLVASRINAAAGASVASPFQGKVRLTSPDVGSSSTFTIIDGNALAKLGFSPGPYFGTDSSPEPRVSWFGDNFPDLEPTPWTPAGGSPVSMIGRSLRIQDESASSYRVYTMSDPAITNKAIDFSSDWKVDARLCIRDFVAGGEVPAVLPIQSLKFAGALVSVDEGPSGKNLEMHLAVDGSGNQFLNLLSFNQTTNKLDVVGQYPFSWNDSEVHSFDIYTSKLADLVLVSADGVTLSPMAPIVSVTYSSLNPGVSGPSLSFGSGSGPVLGFDPATSISTIDWSSVSIFRDSKVSDVDAPDRRYVGLYKGGDPSLVSSYHLHQVDWGSVHTYRLVRDPSTDVSVFMDGGDVPILSVAYDSMSLPTSSFLRTVSGSHSCVAFGSFNSKELFRTRWDFVRYSMGKITTDMRIVPPHQVMGRGSAVSSPDHLSTKKKHSHAGFSVYSGGTPIDDFLADPDLKAYTVLGPGTSPFPMTQNLESRGGLWKVATPASSVSALDFVNQDGFLSHLEDDLINAVSLSPIVSVVSTTNALVVLGNSLQSSYNSHRTQAGVHFANDVVNLASAPVATDLPTCIILLNDLKSVYNQHLVEPGVHSPDDPQDAASSPDAMDLASAAILADELLVLFGRHLDEGEVHVTPDVSNVVSSPDAVDMASGAVLADELLSMFSSHVLDGALHLGSDPSSLPPVGFITGLGHASVDPNGMVVNPDMPVAIGDDVKFLAGPNAGIQVTVVAITQTGFEVDLPLSQEPIRPFCKIVGGDPLLDATSIIEVSRGLHESYERHRASLVHVTQDSINVSSGSLFLTTQDAFDVLNSLKAAFNDHRLGEVVHHVQDLVNQVTSQQVTDPEKDAIALANALKFAFSAHVTQTGVHVTDDLKGVMTADDAGDLPGAILLANEMKLRFNLHRERPRVHSKPDTINQVSSPDAMDVDTIVTLLNELAVKYAAHRVQPGVHGSMVFIRLEPPTDHATSILYEAMKFLKLEDGEASIYPFSDDETWYLDGFHNSRDQRTDLVGGALPNLAQMVGERQQNFPIQAGDDLLLVINGSPSSISFQAGDVTAAAVSSRINSSPGVPAGFASNNGDGRIRLVSPVVGGSSSLRIVGGNAVAKLGLDVPQYVPWFVVSDSPDLASISVAGDSFEYSSSGTRTMIRSSSGLPDAERVELTVRMTIVSTFTPGGPDYDTGICVGISGFRGPSGYAVAIGFDSQGDFKHVILKDLGSGRILFRRPFDWGDGMPHSYRLVRDVSLGVFQLSIIS